jgi:cytoplasmic iron level regulating protein YaaA (DUF328/UPF0246 family)
VLILLPPSEGKSTGGDGPPVNVAALSWPELADTRQRVARTLVTMCQGNAARARERLGLSLALDADRAANALLLTSATMPAGLRYNGVLHDALGYGTLPARARKRADASVVVFSGLWGATRPTDLIPAYRLGIGTALPRLRPLPTLWRAPLGGALDDEIRMACALDLRSSGYSQMYRPTPAAAPGLISIVVTGPDGVRKAASHQAKLAKGRLVRELLTLGSPELDAVSEAADRIGVAAEASDGRIVLRLPAGWGLVGK